MLRDTPVNILVGMQTLTNPSAAKTGSFAKVALPVPVGTAFTYEIPQELESRVFVGCRVEVPFGRRTLSGIVVQLADKSDVPKTKPVQKIYDTYLPDKLLLLTEWIASYYGCSVGEAAQAVLPPLLRKPKAKSPMAGVVVLLLSGDFENEPPPELSRAPRQLELARRLKTDAGRTPVSIVTGDWGFETSHIRALIEKGIVELDNKPGVSSLDAMDPEVTELTSEQAAAFTAMSDAIDKKTFQPMLLHGVTGSGKTELYLRAAKRVLSEGGGCIVLVPEIGLIPQATARYRRVFGGQLAILHSRLTGAERFEMWRRIENGECRIVLGPRSAVFSPIKNLRLIIVDEEQDDSYKQEDKPRYHARNVALMRGKNEELTVVLGSATPSAETVHHASEGRYDYLRLGTRVTGAKLPTIRFVDMREASIEGEFLASELVERLGANIEAGRESILFLNKRGHARFVQCNACGWVANCRNCDISLTYHRVNSSMKCHFCGYMQPATSRCPDCGGAALYFAGVGTQRVELDVAAMFPGVGILRMDADTTSGKDGHRKILEKFSTGEYPILIGTQMVAKGHHFPNVNFVGVLFAEESLYYPDFRSAERTFRQLVQVAGRAGRTSDQGEVVIQTFTPEHNVFRYLSAHDYDGFMSEELELRKQLKYPPFSRLVLASCAGAKVEVVGRVVERWAIDMRRILAGREVDVLGPVPPLVPRIKNRYRQQILLKGKLSREDKRALLESFQKIVRKERGGRSLELRWDVDPETFY